jgi:hypothetical protein
MFWEKNVLRQCFVYNARPKLMTGKTSYSFSFPENIFILIKLAFVLNLDPRALHQDSWALAMPVA